MRRLLCSPTVWALASLALAACSASGNGGISPVGQGGGGGAIGGEGGAPGSGGSGSNINVDGGGGSIDPDATCGYATIPTQREPGSIMLVYDRSCSMDECPDGSTSSCEQCTSGPSKWEQVQGAMAQVLNELPDDIRMGMVLFPDTTNGGNCGEPLSVTVPIDSLDKTRGSLLGYINGSPNGGVTPTQPSLELAYATMQSISGSGRKSVLLVTDGAWNQCSKDDTIYANAQTNWETYQIATIAVGIPGSANGNLSYLSHIGGADREPGCNGEKPDPWKPLQSPDCETQNQPCCHYEVSAGAVQTELVQALKDIASKYLTSCVFKVPKGTDPSKFNSAFVNVYVDNELIYNGQDWGYVGGGTDAIEIYGALCDQLLTGQKDKVEIVLGCATIVK